MLHLSQRDPKWSSVKIGKTNLRIHDWGCTLTGLSMLSSYFGCYKTPAEIARTPGLFTDQGLIIWTSINKLFGGKLNFEWRQVGRDDKRIKASLADPKKAVLIEVNSGKHWVVGIDWNTANGPRIVDPIDGKVKYLFKAYPNITKSTHLFQP